MVNYVPTFLGSVQKAIACTPNNNDNIEIYKQEVLPATSRIRQLSEELGNNKPSNQQIQEVVALLVKIFEIKQVEITERKERLDEIFSRHQLKEMFPDILSSFS